MRLRNAREECRRDYYDALYRFRRAFALAEEMGNVRAACCMLGIHPSTFYRWRRQALRFAWRCCVPANGYQPRMPNAIAPFIE